MRFISILAIVLKLMLLVTSACSQTQLPVVPGSSSAATLIKAVSGLVEYDPNTASTYSTTTAQANSAAIAAAITECKNSKKMLLLPAKWIAVADHDADGVDVLFDGLLGFHLTTTGGLNDKNFTTEHSAFSNNALVFLHIPVDGDITDDVVLQMQDSKYCYFGPLSVVGARVTNDAGAVTAMNTSAMARYGFNVINDDTDPDGRSIFYYSGNLCQTAARAGNGPNGDDDGANDLWWYQFYTRYVNEGYQVDGATQAFESVFFDQKHSGSSIADAFFDYQSSGQLRVLQGYCSPGTYLKINSSSGDAQNYVIDDLVIDGQVNPTRLVDIQNGDVGNVRVRINGRSHTGQSGTISNVSTGNPATITAAGHGVLTGQTVFIGGTNTSAAVNGPQVITKINDNSFSVPVNVTSVTDGTGTFVSDNPTTHSLVRAKQYLQSSPRFTRARDIAMNMHNGSVEMQGYPERPYVGYEVPLNPASVAAVRPGSNTKLWLEAAVSADMHSGRSGTITAVGTGNPATITAPAHGMVTGQTAVIKGTIASAAINGSQVITRVDDDSFTVPVNVASVADGVGTFVADMWVKAFDVASSEDRVQTVPDKSDAGNHVTQSTAGSRPAVNFGNIAHRPALAFYTTSQRYLENTAPTDLDDAVGDLTVIAVAIAGGNFSQEGYIVSCEATGTTTGWALGVDDEKNPFFRVQNTKAEIGSITLDDSNEGRRYLFIGRRDATTGEITVTCDGVTSTPQTGATGTLTAVTNRLMVGARWNGSSQTDGWEGWIGPVHIEAKDMFQTNEANPTGPLIDSGDGTNDGTNRLNYFRAGWGVW